jgi:hypothetical protein
MCRCGLSIASVPHGLRTTYVLADSARRVKWDVAWWVPSLGDVRAQLK